MPAKAVKKAKKEIMATVMEEIKGGEVEAERPKGNRAEKASETLLALVRGEKNKRTASMINVINVDLKKDPTDFVPSNPEPKGVAVLMIPGQWTNAQEFRPVNRSSARGINTLGKESDEESSNAKQNMSSTENDEVKKGKMTKTDPLSIKKKKGGTLKNDRRQDPNFCAGRIANSRRGGKDLTLTTGKEREKGLRIPLS